LVWFPKKQLRPTLRPQPIPPPADILEQIENVLVAADLLFDNPAIAWSGGKDSTLLLWIATQRLNLDYPVIFINTQLLFPETIEFVHKIAKQWGLNLYEATPTKRPPPENPEECCLARKVEPLKRTLKELKSDLLIEEWRPITTYVEYRQPVNRLYPLKDATWTDVWLLIHKYKVPYNPLYDQGYPSLGCKPCTKKAKPKEGERAGRLQALETMKRLREWGYF